MFKRIFGSEENKDVLLAFLNRIFEESEGGRRLTEIVLLDPHTDKDTPEDKLSIMDIWAMADNNELIDIEMQLLNNYDIEKRTLFYWAKRYTGQLKKGHSYRELKKCVTINILNYNLMRDGSYHLNVSRQSGMCAVSRERAIAARANVTGRTGTF